MRRLLFALASLAVGFTSVAVWTDAVDPPSLVSFFVRKGAVVGRFRFLITILHCFHLRRVVLGIDRGNT
jgi:hypothetical protein